MRIWVAEQDIETLMELEEPKCPQCGAELAVEYPHRSVHCPRCGFSARLAESEVLYWIAARLSEFAAGVRETSVAALQWPTLYGALTITQESLESLRERAENQARLADEKEREILQDIACD